jgi:peptidoglycan/LPS O-acetylase OafA/YrhL
VDVAGISSESRAKAGAAVRPRPSAGRRELDLDVVRGVAILLAMGWHINKPTGSPIVDAILAPGRIIGWAGVDLFFVLSGFLVGRLVFREEKITGGFDFPTFFKRRTMKLWPVLYVFLAIMMVATPAHWSLYAWQIGLHVANYFPPVQATHLWSLAVEEHFYLALGTLVPLFLKRRAAWSLWPWLAGLLVLELAARCAGAALGASGQALQWQTQYRIDALGCGVLLALISVQKPELLDRMLRHRLAWAACTILGCGFLVVFGKAEPIGATLGLTVSYLTSAAFLLLVYRSGVDRVLHWPCRVVGFFGLYSYALYIWHVPVVKYAPLVAAKLHLQDATLRILLAYVLATAVAYAMTRLVERPALWLRDRLFPARATAV